MKLFILIILVLSSQLSLGDDSVTIVAVGKATNEQEKLVLSLELDKNLSNKEQNDFKKLAQIIIDDFGFYKSKFEVDDKVYGSKNSSGRYTIELKASLKDKAPWLDYSIEDLKEKSVLVKESKKALLNNLRTFAHSTANILYKGIMGKDSIFNSKIAFVSDRTSSKGKIRKELYLMDFDGQRKERLTFQNSIIISPAISPDNQRVVFTLVDKVNRPMADGRILVNKNLNLYMLELGSRKLKLVSNLKGINSGAVFNQAGDHVYLTLSHNKNADIYKLNLKTGKKRRITSHFAEDVDPHINGDESMLTFLSGRPGKAMIYTMDPTKLESRVKRISFVGEYNAAPRFNPEGSEIVFSSWVDNRFDIYLIGSNGKRLERLTKNFGSNEEPWFSPDGEFIVFSSQRVLSRRKAVQDLYIMDRRGEIIKKITSNYGKIFTPRWSN